MGKLIDADRLARRIAGHSDYHGDSILSAIYCMAEGQVTDVPITPIKQKRRKTATWIKEESPFGWDRHSYQCSKCGRSIHLNVEVEDLDDYPYCHCGAKMQEVSE
jgi:DNA-directed RNA polymerase subunit RPC12/RpoP